MCVCLALVWLCVRVQRQRPFGCSLTVAFVVHRQSGDRRWDAATDARRHGRAEVVDHLGVRARAVALGVVAAAFEIGERLQRDTDNPPLC